MTPQALISLRSLSLSAVHIHLSHFSPRPVPLRPGLFLRRHARLPWLRFRTLPLTSTWAYLNLFMDKKCKFRMSSLLKSQIILLFTLLPCFVLPVQCGFSAGEPVCLLLCRLQTLKVKWLKSFFFYFTLQITICCWFYFVIENTKFVRNLISYKIIEICHRSRTGRVSLAEQ